MSLIKTHEKPTNNQFCYYDHKMWLFGLKISCTRNNKFCINFTCIACNLLWCAQFPITYYITWRDNSQKSRFIFSRHLFKSEIISKLRTRKSERERDRESFIFFCVIVIASSFGLRRRQVTEKYCLQERFTSFPLHHVFCLLNHQRGAQGWRKFWISFRFFKYLFLVKGP